MSRRLRVESPSGRQVWKDIVIAVISGLIVAAILALIRSWSKLPTWQKVLAFLTPLLLVGVLFRFWKKVFSRTVGQPGDSGPPRGPTASATHQTQIVIQGIQSGASVSVQIVQAPDYQNGMPKTSNMESKAAYEAGRAALDRDDFDDAIEQFSRCLQLETDWQKLGAVNIQIANCYFKQGRLSKAKEHYATAHRIGKRIPDRHGRAAGLLGLGNVYLQLPVLRTSDRRRLIRHAIALYNDALRIFRKEVSPLQAANTRLSLGSAYAHLPARSAAKKGKNLARAVGYFRAALEFYTEDEYPVEFANATEGLATAYIQLPSGSPADRADNVRLAIKHFRIAVKLYRESGSIGRYTMALMGLGNAYAELPVSSQAERERNYKKAFACYKKALAVGKDSLTPDQKAKLQLNLANAYLDLPAATAQERSQNVQNAISCFLSALETHDKQRCPLDFGAAQIGLGGAYCDYSELPTATKQERQNALEKAVDCFNEALDIYDKKGYPVEYATIQGNLAAAFMRWPADSHEERVQAVQRAVGACQAALEVVHRNHPEVFACTAATLGSALSVLGNANAHYWLNEAYALRQFLPDHGERVEEIIREMSAKG
jgi:tetratricopeptide (TPR) repeat protein